MGSAEIYPGRLWVECLFGVKGYWYRACATGQRLGLARRMYCTRETHYRRLEK